MILSEKCLQNLKEDSHVELKEATKRVPDSLYETYSSFSNSDGGTIYLGIKEGKKNEIVGVSNPAEQKKTLISALHSKNKVSYCGLSDQDIQIIDVGGKKIICLTVRKAPIQAKPVYIDGNLSKSYIRVGEGDYLMSEDDIAHCLLEKKGVGIDFLPNHLNIGENGIDLDSLTSFRQRMNLAAPNNIYQRLSNHDFLVRIGALTTVDGEEILRNGGVLFFGIYSDIIQLFPNYFLDYQENRTRQTRWDKRRTSDDLNWNANLYNFFKIASEEATKGLPNPFRTDGRINLNGNDIRRSVIEGIVNAISNCDFTSSPGILVRKEQEKISITNSGTISVGLEQALKGGISNPLNKNVRNYFRLLQVSDRAGSGIPSIFQVFQSYNFARPDLKTELNPERTVLNLNLIQLPVDLVHKKEKLKIVSYLADHAEGGTRKDLSSLIGRKATSTAKILSDLVQANLIRSNGRKTKGKRFYIFKK